MGNWGGKGNRNNICPSSLRYDKKLIAYSGGTTDSWTGFKLKNGKLYSNTAFYIYKDWQSNGKLKCIYYVNGKKVSKKRYYKKFNNLKALKTKNYR